MKNGERIFVLCAFAEINSSFANEQEAGEAIMDVVRDEGIDADDFTVVRGVEIQLQVEKPKGGKIKFDNKEVYGVAE